MVNGGCSKEDRLWTKEYTALLMINFLLCFGFYMLPPTLPAYIKQIGGNNLQASLIFGMFSSTSMITRIIAGNIIDAKGEKMIMLLGMAIVVVCTLSFTWLPINSILLLRSFQGVGWGMATTAIAAAVYKTVPEKKRGEGSGYYSLTTIISMSLTPMVAILLMNHFHFALVIITSAVLAIIGIFVLVSGSAKLPSEPVTRAMRQTVTLKNVLEKGAILPSFLCFLLSISVCGIMGFLMLFGKEIQLDNVWLFFIGYTIAILLTRPFAGRLFDRKGHAYIILPGSLLIIAGLVTLSYTHSAIMLVIASLLYGVGYGAAQPSLQTWSVNRCPENRKGAANGLFLSSIDLGYIVGSIPLGQIAEVRGYAAMYGYLTVIIVLFLITYGIACIKAQKEKLLQLSKS